ncbi:hypothetical protein M768_03385 [Cellulosimicrobium cellulans F16]|uniref:Uncharacterized protein n=1 Tax=Cellulosimicrobium cellulans F16 TaxID=1350482 RepID=A0A0M0FBN0_CELCE|nr:hypothetical protein M768_03385 [Cellulosimicrobium cellulans F16]
MVLGPLLVLGPAPCAPVFQQDLAAWACTGVRGGD